MKRLTDILHGHTGTALVLGFLLLHLVILPHYGFTWDFHFHFFGGGKLLGIDPSVMEPRNLPFVEPDPRRAWTLPYGPIMSIPPVATYWILYRSWHLLPADVSYHLPIVFWGVAGIGILYAFMKEAAGKRAAVLAALFLALTPRFFADTHNNMKDVPSATMFAVNVWFLWRLVTKKRIHDLLWAVLAFAAAFSVKINAVFIPAVFGAWLAVRSLMARKLPVPKRTLWYFVLSPVAAFLLWWMFWPDPVGQLKHAYLTFGVGTNNIEVLLNGAWYCSGSTVPWYYPFWYLGITTPLPILFFAAAGIALTAIAAARRAFVQDTHKPDVRVLLVLWLFVPLSRYLHPNVGVIDGIRHFEEVVFPIAALAALTLDYVLRAARRIRFPADTALLAGIFAWLAANIILYHPYQVAYFNEFVGGARGALGKYDLDYWGTSQKEAVEWVNANAPPGARVNIVMATAVAGQYLRPDLLATLNQSGYAGSDFVILLNRTSFLYRFFYAYEFFLTRKPAHVISVRGAPLVWIYDNRTDNVAPRGTPFWGDEDPCIRKYWRGEQP